MTPVHEPLSPLLPRTEGQQHLTIYTTNVTCHPPLRACSKNTIFSPRKCSTYLWNSSSSTRCPFTSTIRSPTRSRWLASATEFLSMNWMCKPFPSVAGTKCNPTGSPGRGIKVITGPMPLLSLISSDSDDSKWTGKLTVEQGLCPICVGRQSELLECLDERSLSEPSSRVRRFFYDNRELNADFMKL